MRRGDDSDADRHIARQLEVALLKDDTDQTAQRALAAGVRHLPVMDDNDVLGMISMRDLLAIETWG